MLTKRTPTFDPDCLTLAEHFLDDDPRAFSDADYADLAATIQIAIQDWFADREDNTSKASAA